MTAPLSSIPLNVAARTLAGSNPSHSLKATGTAAKCAHTGQGVKPATEASGGVWRVISGAYGLGKNRSRPNSRQHSALRGCAHLAAHGEAHLTRNSRARIGSNGRAHIVATIWGHLGDANTGQTSGQLATFKSATSRLHSRPPPVGYI